MDGELSFSKARFTILLVFSLLFSTANAQQDSVWVCDVKFTNSEFEEKLNIRSDNNYPSTAFLGVMAAKEKNGDAPVAPAVQTAPADMPEVEIPADIEYGKTAAQLTDEAAEKVEDVVEQATEAVKEAVDAAAKIEVTVPDVNK